MTKTEAKKRIEKLRGEINYHRHLYHVLDKQEISDAANDSLKHELEDLEQQYPDLITADSPTQRVGGQALPKFVSVAHDMRMLSLNDMFSMDELKAWEARNQKIVPARYEYFVELKIDGVALSLIYEDNVLIRAATRGDGSQGEDVTQNIKTIEAIPLRLQEKVPERLEVRGEAYMLKKDFDRMNAQQVKAGKPAFANPRNVSAGSIRQLDPAMTASRPLRFFAWEITQGLPIKTRQEEYGRLQELGFPVPPGATLCASMEEVGTFLAQATDKRLNHPFQVDGLVVKINDLAISRRLGVVGKAPRGSAAFKFAAEEATTIVEDIVVQVGRTGTLTPVAHLKPVQVAGTTVSRATLHNADEIARKDVRIGDTVIIHKAGDIIPEIVKVLPNLRPAKTKPFKMPTKCPICGSPVTQAEDGVAVKCTNQNCFSQERERILHAVSRAAFDIEGLGEKITEQLIQEGLIEDAADLWDLTEGDLLPLERFAEKSAKKLIEEIAAKKKFSLSRFLVALSIPHVGTVTAQHMARVFRTLEKLLAAGEETLSNVPGVGEKTAPAVHAFLHNSHTKHLLAKYKKFGIIIMAEKTGGPLAGKTFVFTGSMAGMTRDEAKQRVQGLGALTASTVGEKVDYLVAGIDAGSKLKKAKELGVTVLSPAEFDTMIRENRHSS
ncbi:MAG: NAD-dependent DNA ligase LigA [Candidatus Andersenbacteria bacterium]|nr:NAD-dependent DNA ligase LigA [Candidatus Andersenbacteria bacterium]